MWDPHGPPFKWHWLHHVRVASQVAQGDLVLELALLGAGYRIGIRFAGDEGAGLSPAAFIVAREAAAVECEVVLPAVCETGLLCEGTKPAGNEVRSRSCNSGLPLGYLFM
jgi:hypothetical protein